MNGWVGDEENNRNGNLFIHWSMWLITGAFLSFIHNVHTKTHPSKDNNTTITVTEKYRNFSLSKCMWYVCMTSLRYYEGCFYRLKMRRKEKEIHYSRGLNKNSNLIPSIFIFFSTLSFSFLRVHHHHLLLLVLFSLCSCVEFSAQLHMFTAYCIKYESKTSILKCK